MDVTPASVAISSLQECRQLLQRAYDTPLATIHAATEANRALQAALTAALAGSANIGASPEKIRGQWISWFEENRNGRSSKTPSWRVMGVREMLLDAVLNPLPWTNAPLQLSAQESFWIGRLLFFRDSFEHPKQLTFLMTKSEVAESIEGTVDVIHRALLTISHQIYEELENLAALIAELRTLAGQIGEVS